MRTIQITIDDELVERIDERAKLLGSTRSGFARHALQTALARYEESEAEARHIAGYDRIPAAPQEFAIRDEDHVWGDDPWDAGKDG